MKYYLILCIWLGGFSYSLNAQPPAIPYGNNPAAGRYYAIRGIRMYCEIYGKGQPLLMIHGNGGSMQAFYRNIPFFSNKYQVILADSRAQGKSRDAGDSLSFEMMADDFAALLDTLHLDSVDVVGWSDGGINALLLAIRHPEKVRKLAATGANLWPDSTAFVSGFWQSEKEQYDSAVLQPRNTPAEKNDWKIFLLDWDQPHISLSELFEGVRCPALIVCGDHDLISIRHTVEIYRHIRRANLWVVPNSSHSTLQDHPNQFNKNVDQFFSEPFQNR